MKPLETLHSNWRELLPTGAQLPDAQERLELSRDQWRERLQPQAYSVLRQESTERAGTSPLNDEHRAGVFVCAGCGLALFSSPMKFDSGTGWPSFFTAIPGSVATKTDFKMILPRTEYHCVRCGGHQGHVFEDGPAPSGLRYCNNGVALKFLPSDLGSGPAGAG
jgi:peptide-methionine (R)-S-oxide reductase